MVAMELCLFLWLYLANSQVSVYRTIGPLVIIAIEKTHTHTNIVKSKMHSYAILLIICKLTHANCTIRF